MGLIGIDVNRIRPMIDRVPGKDMAEKAMKCGISKHRLVQAFKGRASIATVGAIKKNATGTFHTNFSGALADVEKEDNVFNAKENGKKTYNSRKQELKKFSLENLLEEIIRRGYEITLRS